MHGETGHWIILSPSGAAFQAHIPLGTKLPMSKDHICYNSDSHAGTKQSQTFFRSARHNRQQYLKAQSKRAGTYSPFIDFFQTCFPGQQTSVANPFVRTPHQHPLPHLQHFLWSEQGSGLFTGLHHPTFPLSKLRCSQGQHKHSFLLKDPSLFSLVEQRTSQYSSRLVSKWRIAKWKWSFRKRFIPFISSAPHPCRLSCCISILMPTFLCTSSYLLWLQKDKGKIWPPSWVPPWNCTCLYSTEWELTPFLKWARSSTLITLQEIPHQN